MIFDALLSISLIYVLVQLVLVWRSSSRTVVLWWISASALYFLCSLEWIMLIAGMPEKVFSEANLTGWLQVSGVSTALVALGIENWNDRPQIARFPYVFTHSPVILILTYLLVYDTLFLKDVLIAIYEAGALTVALLLFMLFTFRSGVHLTSLIGILLLIFGFIAFWFPSDTVAFNPWIWQILLITGSAVFAAGYPKSSAELTAHQSQAGTIPGTEES